MDKSNYKVFIPAWARSPKAKSLYGGASLHKTVVKIKQINNDFYETTRQALKRAGSKKLGLWSIAPKPQEGRGVHIERYYIDPIHGPMMSSCMLHENWLSKINSNGTWECICGINLLTTQGCQCGGV